MKKSVSVLTLGLLLIGVQAFAADGDLIVNGKVGIGIPNPAFKMHIQGYDGDDTFGIKNNSGNNAIYIRPSGVGGGVIDLNNNSGATLVEIRGDTNPTYFNGGNVGIGTTNPGSYKLYVAGSTYLDTAFCLSGYWSGSDIRWKKNVEPIANALSLIENLQGVRFDWDAEALKATAKAKVKQGDPDKAQIPIGIEGRQVGLIAQDVEKVLPELVKTDADGYKAVSYEKLTAVLLQAVKELKAEVEKLKGMRTMRGVGNFGN